MEANIYTKNTHVIRTTRTCYSKTQTMSFVTRSRRGDRLRRERDGLFVRTTCSMCSNKMSRCPGVRTLLLLFTCYLFYYNMLRKYYIILYSIIYIINYILYNFIIFMYIYIYIYIYLYMILYIVL